MACDTRISERPATSGPNKDALLELGSGATLNQQLASATLVTPTGGRRDSSSAPITVTLPFAREHPTICSAPGARCCVAGLEPSMTDPSITSGRICEATITCCRRSPSQGAFNYLSPIASVLPGLAQTSPPSFYSFPNVTLVAPNLLNGRSSSYFAGIQHRVTNDFTIEVNGLGTYGRNLITTDIINREFTTADGNRVNPNLPDINYRANQGFSDYNALTVVARYRWSRGYLQGSYTWSHYIDNQSDPLTGDFFDLSFTNISSGSGTGKSGFHAAIRSERRPGEFRLRSAAQPGCVLLLESSFGTARLQGASVIPRLDRVGSGGFPVRPALYGDRQHQSGDPR